MDLKKQQLPELKEFISRNYRPDYILLNENFFSWFFCNHIQQERKEEYSFKVLIFKDMIAGMIGRIPYSFKFINKDINASFLVNTMIENELRGLGLGPRLVLEAGADQDMVYTTSYGASAKPMYQKLNWNEMGNLNRYVFVLDSKIASDLASIALQKSEIPQTATASHEIRQMTSFDKSFDTFWNQIKQKYPITINRTSDYLNWRYRNHPTFSYEIIAAYKDQSLAGYLISRTEKASNGALIQRIIDMVSEDTAEIPLLTHITRNSKAHLIDFMFTGAFHAKSLEKAGFVDAYKNCPALPTVFNPIDRNRNSIPFAFRILNHDLPEQSAQDINNWYITKADGDQDRPN